MAALVAAPLTSPLSHANSAGTTDAPIALSIAEIQGTADVSPQAGKTVETIGVVTATYPTGGFNGFYPQTAGTGGALDLDTRTASDGIRTAFTYRAATVEPVGESFILIGSLAFDNAREPLARAFEPMRASKGSKVLVIANHFKSKSGGAATGDKVDAGPGAYNGDRTRQTKAVVAFVDRQKAVAKTERVVLVGDFNAYEQEDPILTIAAAGYVDQVPKTGKQTYAFDGMVGSLDHVFASTVANRRVSGADVWNINSVESVGLEYSRFNANATNLYEVSPYRSRDHDPVILGLNLPIRGGWGRYGGGGEHHG